MSYNPIDNPAVLATLPAAPETATRAYLVEYGEDISQDAQPSARIEQRPVEVAPDDPDEVLIIERVPRPPFATAELRPGTATPASKERIPAPETLSRVVENVERIPPPPGVSTVPRSKTVTSIVTTPPAPASMHRIPNPNGSGSTTPTTPPARNRPQTTAAARTGTRVWAFLTNPQTIDYTSGQASYSEITAHASTRSHLHYSHTTNEVWKLSDLLLDTWCEGKHVKPLLDGIRALMEADVSGGVYEPPTMEFVMGSRRSGPCKVTSVSWSETRWLDGYPAGVKLSLELKRIPFPERSQNYLDLPAISESSGLAANIALTDRQMEDARTAARIYLEDKLTDYAPSVQELVRSGVYTLTPGTDGVVEMKDDAGNVIGIVGQWDGRELRVQGVNSIPIAPPVEEEKKATETEAELSDAKKEEDPTEPEAKPPEKT